MGSPVKTKTELSFEIFFSRIETLSSQGTDAVSRPVASSLKVNIPDGDSFIPFQRTTVKRDLKEGSEEKTFFPAASHSLTSNDYEIKSAAAFRLHLCLMLNR